MIFNILKRPSGAFYIEDVNVALLNTDSCVTLMNTEGLGQNNVEVVWSVPGEKTTEQVIARWITSNYIYELDSCTSPVLGGVDLPL